MGIARALSGCRAMGLRANGCHAMSKPAGVRYIGYTIRYLFGSPPRGRGVGAMHDQLSKFQQAEYKTGIG